MADSDSENMGRRRFVLTDTQRELFAGLDVDRKNRLYEERSRFRAMLRDEAPTDLDLLAEHEPELYAELVSTVAEHADDHADLLD